MAEQELLLDTLSRIESKLDVAAQNAVLARQAAELLANKVDDHIAQDRAMHTQINQRLNPLEHFRTKAVAYLLVVGFVASFIVGLAKEAIANTFFPPHH